MNDIFMIIADSVQTHTDKRTLYGPIALLCPAPIGRGHYKMSAGVSLSVCLSRTSTKLENEDI